MKHTERSVTDLHVVTLPIRGRSRDEVASAVISALCEDFLAHGAETIRAIRAERPADYVKILLSLLPKETEKPARGFDAVGDEELEALITGARARLALSRIGGTQNGGPDDEQPSGILSTVSETG